MATLLMSQQRIEISQDAIPSDGDLYINAISETSFTE